MTKPILVLAAVAIALGACSSAPPEADPLPVDQPGDPAAVVEEKTDTENSVSGTEEVEIVEEIVPTPPAATGPEYRGNDYPTELTGLVGIAVADLSEHLGVAAAAITVVRVEEVTWSDAAMGCPQPGMSYAQVLSDGLRITLAHDGTEHVYHSGGMAQPFRCAPGVVVKELPDAIDPEDVFVDPGDKSGTGDTLPTEQPGGPGGEPDV